MTDSNLSRTKPALRTKGNITGNFGQPKSKAGSQLTDIGLGEVGSLPTIDQQLTTFLAVYPRMRVQWRRNMLPLMRRWGATLGRQVEVKLTAESYSL